jgi:hypothetical protein
MVERQREPGACVPGPDRLLVCARVEAEDMRHAGLGQLAVELLVLRANAPVLAPYVEGEESSARASRAACSAYFEWSRSRASSAAPPAWPVRIRERA